MSQVVVLSRLSSGLAVISYDGDVTVWSKGRIRRRPNAPEVICPMTKRSLNPGAEAYRPVHSGKVYRMVRLSPTFVERVRIG
jgi:hypothetical protein